MGRSVAADGRSRPGVQAAEEVMATLPAKPRLLVLSVWYLGYVVTLDFSCHNWPVV